MQICRNIFIEKLLIWTKLMLKLNKIMPNIPFLLKTLNLDNSSKNTEFKKKSF